MPVLCTVATFWNWLYLGYRVSIESDIVDQVVRVLVVIGGIERRVSAEREIEATIPSALPLRP